jgi:hypothetical protein
MRTYRLKRTQLLPVSVNTAWQFFSFAVSGRNIFPYFTTNRSSIGVGRVTSGHFPG